MPGYVHQENGIRLEVWETNKGYTLGLFRWRVQSWDIQLELWVTVAKNNYPQMYEDAMVEGQRHYDLADAKRQAQALYITPEDKERLMEEFGLTEEDFYSGEA